MIKLLEKLYWGSRKLFNALTPRFLSMRLDADAFGIVKFMETASKEVMVSDKVLDAGAGVCPYKKYFSHAKYESTDFEHIFDKSASSIHDFVCSLDKVPKADNSYDVIINTQVLEHVQFPQKVIDEFYRILKPGGKLFLTAPQGWGIHGEPYHYFNFTKFGLESLFEHAGFKIVYINPRGGMFWYLGSRIRSVPGYIFYQYVVRKSQGTFEFKPKPLAIILLPFYIISLPICAGLIPLLFFYLDKLDQRQDFTLGYACYCRKVARDVETV